MSNPEKAKIDTEKEINENSDESDYHWSDEEGDVREIVLALPALSVSERLNFDDQALRQKATVAAELVLAAAENAKADQTVLAGIDESGEKSKKKKVGRPRKVRLEVAVPAAGASSSIAIGSGDGGESAKKPRKQGSTQLRHPPQGPPKCNICGRGFLSWKAVFGHLRSHKDRGYQGFLPPPKFNPAEEALGGAVGASSSSGGFGLGTGGLEIDLNAEPLEKEEGTSGSGSTTPKFDLNRSPPQDDDQEEKKAE